MSDPDMPPLDIEPPDIEPLDIDPFDILLDLVWDFFMPLCIDPLFIEEPFMPLLDGMELEPVDPDDIDPVEPVVWAIAPVAKASVAAQTSAVLITGILLKCEPDTIVGSPPLNAAASIGF